MKENYTHITIVLDKSASMVSLKQETIDTINNFVYDQAKLDGECTLGLTTFSSNVVFNNIKDIRDFVGLNINTYITTGMTALYDAVGVAITNTGMYLEKLSEDNRPSKVVLVILTDGEENCSKSYDQKKVFDMITHQKDKYGWQVMFLAANQDAFIAGKKLGIDYGSTMSYDASGQGLNNVSSSLSRGISTYRAGGQSMAVFTDEDRKLQEELINK